MTSRALIIAIEDYANAQGMEKKLTGTLDAGLEFKAWVEAKWAADGRAAADTQMLFCSEPVIATGRHATRDDVIDALDALVAQGRGTTEELFFFFSGHGFAFVTGLDKRADVIIASDYTVAKKSGPSCFNLDEMANWLRAHLGARRQYFFVDACRNPLSQQDIPVGANLIWDPQASGEASTYILQSTEPGAVAMVGGPFPDELLSGLRGKGSAKIWADGDSQAMYVRYDSLRAYLRKKLPKQKIFNTVQGVDGESDGVLATLRPVPQSTCSIVIRNAPSPLQGDLVYTRGRSDTEKLVAVTGPSMKMQLPPDSYTFGLRIQGQQFVPVSGSRAVDLYDDQEVTFDAGAPASAAIGAGEGLVRGKSVLTEGTYDSKLADSALEAGAFEMRTEFGAAPAPEWAASPPHVSIASHFPVQGDAVDFSESLGGPVADPDLNLWLALVGGGRILGSLNEYSKIGKVPLHDFSGEVPGASPIYVLAGVPNEHMELNVSVSNTAAPLWMRASQPGDLSAIRDAYFPTRAGSYLVSIGVAGEAPYTIASHAIPNRATLITVVLDDDGPPQLAQFLLPIGHLVDHLDPYVRDRVRERPSKLEDVRFLVSVHRVFSRRGALSKEVNAHDLDWLLYAKWLDPIGSSLAAYECLRRGQRAQMQIVVDNMQQFFPSLPDTAALAKLAGRGVPPPVGRRSSSTACGRFRDTWGSCR